MESDGADHFPKSEIVDDHKYSVDVTTFKKIVRLLCEERVEQLIKGEQVKLPLRSGTLQIKKYRNAKSIDWHSTNKVYGDHNKNNPKDKRFLYHKNYHSQGYKPILIWDRKVSTIKNKWIFKIKFTRLVNRYIARRIKEDPLIISNLNEA